MLMKLNKKAPIRLRAVLAIITIFVLLTWAGPASARLDELIRVNVPYITPPAAELAAAQRFYEVKSGDTLTAIAVKNGISIEALAAANRLVDCDRIKVGQLLTVPSEYFTHLVQPGETMWEISKMYRVEVADLAARNGQANADRILAGQRLIVPCRDTVQESRWTASRGLSAGPFSWPLVGAITSTFGMRDGRPHEGIDIAAEEGTPIRAAASGRVVFAGPRGTYGLAVIIEHGGGLSTLYAHCSRIMVEVGDSVGTSTVIALAGNTGNSRGPHLHLEVQKNGVPLDPLTLLEQERYYG
ncbi:MAG: peptidoglycan DD-metalloendopeptidase family protein [Pelotomaculaceae bacterium]|jgi:murein DD-endopeptidase MepM/ murein hydrolase activator NlpD|uniref:Murein DD-endopeptidase MepM n=1 Tax=anaerobic digester metagenome TaxID=1263854 RepID=A0A485LWA2_9ZZZZ|nr:M23 family metallopeptidase [Bacillota bacterium]HHU86782.1 M23 family metallopeptidase [Peptococcaceae bacterium]